MKILPGLIFILLSALLSYCKKDKTNSIQPKLQYAVFSDIVNGKKLAGLTINLLTTVERGGSLIDIPLGRSLITDSDGRIEYTDNKVNAFDCTAPGYFQFVHYGVGLIVYDGLTYNVKLLPKAYLNVHLAPSSIYPVGYKFSMDWSCKDSMQTVNTYGLVDFPDYVNPVDSSFIITIGGDIYNDISWKLVDGNYNLIAGDTIRNIAVPRFDTAGINITF